MIFTLVNKNFLIPVIERDTNFNLLLQKLYEFSYNKDKTYCLNIYIVTEQEIYFCNDNQIYCSKNKIITKVDYNLLSFKSLEDISFFCNNQNSEIKTNITDMNFSIKEKINKNIIIVDDKINKNISTNNMIYEDHIKKEETISNKEFLIKNSNENKPKIKSQEELEIIKLIEETMEIYQNEVRKIKDIERQIKIIDDDTNSLIKKKKEKSLTNFSKLKNDYKTYTLIKRKKKLKPETSVPNLFELKYEFFNELVKNEETKILLEKINVIDLDEVLNQKYEINDDMLLLSNRYGDDSKKLNVKFEHSWEDLEIETEASENNNSKFGVS